MSLSSKPPLTFQTSPTLDLHLDFDQIYSNLSFKTLIFLSNPPISAFPFYWNELLLFMAFDLRIPIVRGDRSKKLGFFWWEPCLRRHGRAPRGRGTRRSTWSEHLSARNRTLFRRISGRSCSSFRSRSNGRIIVSSKRARCSVGRIFCLFDLPFSLSLFVFRFTGDGRIKGVVCDLFIF